MKHILLFLTLLTTGVHASPLPSIYVSDGTTLYQLNPTNAAQIGSQALSISALQGMAFASDGTLYGTFVVGLNHQVGTIDTSTGNVSLLSQIASPGGLDLAFSGLSLYERATDENIYAVDTATGAVGAHYVCSVFGNGFAIGGDGMAWLGGDNQVNEYTLATGGSCTGSGGGSFSGSGATALLAHLSYADGVMYAIDSTSHQLDTFDGNTFPSGGIPSLSTIGSVSSSFNSLAVYANTSSVPEPTALSIVGTGLIGLAGLLYRRRRTR